MKWIQITSWHAYNEGTARTLCGRHIPLTRVPIESRLKEELPAGKSCETCLRIYARKEDEV